MNRILHRPTPLSVKSKLVEEVHQLDKYYQQKKKQQPPKNTRHHTSQQNKIIGKQKQSQNQLYVSKDESVVDSIKEHQARIQNRIRDSPKTGVFKLVQVPCPSSNSNKSMQKQSSFIISSQNQLQYSMVESQSVSSKSSLRLHSNSRIDFINTEINSFRNLPVEQPQQQQLQSRVIETINIKNSTNNCYESSTRLNQFHNTLQESHNSNKQPDKSLFDLIFQNICSDLNANSNLNQQAKSAQKSDSPLTTQKKKPSQQERQTPPSTLPFNNRLSEFQSPKISPYKKNKLRSVSRRLPSAKQETPPPKIVLNEQKTDAQNKLQPSILALVAGLSKNYISEQIETLRNKMVNQKNLKLRDYLRLASLSNDARFDNYKKQSRNIRSNSVNRLQVPKSNSIVKKSSLFNKQKSIIDPSKSISLIKKSLKKKLQKSIEMALKVFEDIQNQKQIMDKEYDDLVFICNLHRLFDENIFQTADLLEDLFEEYKSKRKFNSVLEEKEQLTQQAVIQLFSPRKKKKNEKKQQSVMSIFERLLLGLKIIKREQLRQA